MLPLEDSAIGPIADCPGERVGRVGVAGRVRARPSWPVSSASILESATMLEPAATRAGSLAAPGDAGDLGALTGQTRRSVNESGRTRAGLQLLTGAVGHFGVVRAGGLGVDVVPVDVPPAASASIPYAP